MNNVVLAADIGGTNLRVAAVERSGKILSRVRIATPRSGNTKKILEGLFDAAKSCLRESGDCNAVGVSVAIPATIDYKSGKAIKAPNLAELEGASLVADLRDIFDLPCLIENDANAAAIGENWLGASKGTENSIMVTLGTGVGGGLIVNSEILRGLDGTAGEIGHICVEPDGVNCGCGSHGCVEQYASAAALVRQALDIAGAIGDPDWLNKEGLSSSDLYHFAKMGNPVAVKVFEKQGFYLGLVLAGLINSLNPELIVIGGGAAGGWDLFIPQTKEQIRIRAYSKPAERAKLVRAELGDDAGILGAAFLGFDVFDYNS